MLRWIKRLLNKEKGALFTVTGFKNQQVASKLLSVGILPGSQLQVIRKAPNGFVFFIKVDGISIALRQNELESIILSKNGTNG